MMTLTSQMNFLPPPFSNTDTLFKLSIIISSLIYATELAEGSKSALFHFTAPFLLGHPLTENFQPPPFGQFVSQSDIFSPTSGSSGSYNPVYWTKILSVLYLGMSMLLPQEKHMVLTGG